MSKITKTAETKNLTYVMALSTGELHVRKGGKIGKDVFNITEICPSFTDLPEATESHDRRMMMHGFKQKLVDQISGLKKALGRDVEIADVEASMREVFDNMAIGVDHWNFKRESSGKIAHKTAALRKIDEKLAAGVVDTEWAEMAKGIVEIAYAE